MSEHPAGDSWVDLYWLPVGAGTRFQKTSLRLYESIAARLSHREPQTLVHAGLVGSLDGERFTLELMPALPGANADGEVTGPVGVRLAGRVRIFRYQVCLSAKDVLPDQEWAVAPALRLTEGAELVRRLRTQARRVPSYTWGRKRRGHPEMWTSDSAVSWILATAGIDAAAIRVPSGCRAPGWRAGLFEAAAR
jgi:hypothetical protein